MAAVIERLQADPDVPELDSLAALKRYMRQHHAGVALVDVVAVWCRYRGWLGHRPRQADHRSSPMNGDGSVAAIDRSSNRQPVVTIDRLPPTENRSRVGNGFHATSDLHTERTVCGNACAAAISRCSAPTLWRAGNNMGIAEQRFASSSSAEKPFTSGVKAAIRARHQKR
jgi:hypothetical protein